MAGVADTTPGERTIPTGDDTARVTALVETHFDFIWRVLRRLGLQPADADDVAQQVFMIATEKLASIATGKERSFLYGSALRLARNRKRAVMRGALALEQTALLADPAPGPERQAQLGQAVDLLDAYLAALPDELRRVLILVEIEQLSVPELAQLEGIPLGTASSRLRRARAAFSTALGRRGGRNPFSEQTG